MRYLLSLSLLLLALTANARQIKSVEALAAAQDFFNNSTVEHSRAPRAIRARALNATQPEDTAPYYIFNASDNNGFVIISGDDRVTKVLGYSDKGNFDVTNMPPQLSAMLDRFAESLTKLSGSTTDQSWNAPSRAASADGGVLLETANWGQGYPYNAQCPEGCVTGCVATAMAILMKYHGWPNRGRSSNKNPYEPELGEYSFDTTYDWENALLDYSQITETPSLYSQDQINAVAKIMHDCGTAIEAIYNQGGMTSADTYDCAYALRNFFYYDGNLGYSQLEAIDVNNDHALSFIIDEIDAARPVIISGESRYEGHAFVIDGYNSERMLHVNWGWDGGANGYFQYPILGDYYSNYMLYNVKPTDEWVEYSPWEVPVDGSLNLDVVDVKQNQYFNAFVFHITSSNIFRKPYPEIDKICTGTLAIALTDKDGYIKEILRQLNINDWYNDCIKGSYAFTGLRVTTPIADTDRIALISKPTGYKDWVNFNNPPFVYTSRPVKGNTPKVANVNVEFIGEKFSYTTKAVGTEGEYLQTKPMASADFTVEFTFPAGKNYIWIGSSELPIGSIHTYNNYFKPCSYISLPYEHGPMNKTIYAMAYNESDLIQDWTEVNMETAGTLNSMIDNDKRIRTKKLRITGVMNNDDFKFIRNNMPLVKHLDLANVRIVSDQYNPFDDYIPDQALCRKRLDSIILPKTLKGIGLEGLRENSFDRIEFPATLEYLGLGAFWEGGDVDLMDIICNNPVPPTIQGGQLGNEENMFEQSTYARATLWVPEGSKNDYLNYPYVWHNFKNIKEFVPSNITDVICDSESGIVEVYNLQGFKVFQGDVSDMPDLPSGIYLKRVGDKVVKIVI